MLIELFSVTVMQLPTISHIIIPIALFRCICAIVLSAVGGGSKEVYWEDLLCLLVKSSHCSANASNSCNSQLLLSLTSHFEEVNSVVPPSLLAGAFGKKQ